MTFFSRITVVLVTLLSFAALLVTMPSAAAQESPEADADIVFVAGYGERSCALDSSGSIQCWGSNFRGALGNPATSDSPFPLPVEGIDDATMISRNCALLDTGRVKCWGANYAGQLGNGTVVPSSTPVFVTGITDAVSILDGGFARNCAILQSGELKCWGLNRLGELGNGTTVSWSVPVTVLGISNAVEVKKVGDTSCALLGDGTVRCWGYNADGQLGNGSTVNTTVPNDVVGISNATGISISPTHSCAVLDTGEVTCWGRNRDGQLGNGTTVDSSVPVAVQGITNAVSVTATSDHTCALLSDGGLQCWGDGAYGQLGSGAYGDSSVPVAVQGISNATEVSLAIRLSCARLDDGAVKCWGRNTGGNLGDGTFTGSPAPVMVQGITNATQIVNMSGSLCALLADGGVQCWGDNLLGSLGDGTTVNSNVPVSVVFNATSRLVAGSATSSDGWAIVDGHRRYISPACRTQLLATDRTFEVLPWADISALPQLPGLPCDVVANIPAADPELPEPPEPPVGGEATFVTNSASNSAGWAIVDGTRQWIGATCRTQLEAAGATFTITTWADISANPNTSSSQTCDQLEANIGEPPEPPVGGDAEFVTNSGANTAGWAIVDGSRQWLNAACRSQLEAAGATFTITTWADISANPNTSTPQTCDQLEASIGEPPANGEAEFVTNSGANTAGWAIVDGTRQWLNAACRSQLEAAGATFTITTWADISANPNTSAPQTCNQLEAEL